MTKTTLDHYNRTADAYVAVNHELSAPAEDRQFFLDLLKEMQGQAQGVKPVSRRLLDAGSGSGRDTLAFMAEGWTVDAFDGSAAMAAHSSRLTGQTTKVMQFEHLDLPQGHYDAVWAMASLLHVARLDLPRVLVDLTSALKPGGLLFASFKEGITERVDEKDGRVFTDLNDDGVRALISSMEGVSVTLTRSRAGPDTERGRGLWFSMVLQRVGVPRLVDVPASPGRRVRVRP